MENRVTMLPGSNAQELKQTIIIFNAIALLQAEGDRPPYNAFY